MRSTVNLWKKSWQSINWLCDPRLWSKKKVAPYTFTVAHALRTKYVHAQRKTMFFMTPTWAQEVKLTVNVLVYPLVKFSKIWQTGIGSKYVTILIVRTRFSGISAKPVFTAVKDKFAKIINCLYKPYFFVFIICVLLDAMCCENFRNFYQRKFKNHK